MCFCQLAGGFDTDVVLQDDGHLIDGGMRVKRSEKQDIFNTHEFKNDGIEICKEFRRRALANCVSSRSHALASAPEERLLVFS